MTSDRLNALAACERLTREFCIYSDRGQVDEYVGVFAEEGTFSRPGLEAKGREAIRAALLQRPDHIKARHLCTNVIVEFESDDRAVGTGTQLLLTYDHFERVTHPPIVVDFYDTYVRTVDGWKIASRAAVPAF